jgi:chromosome segregation ATPase
MRRVGLDAASEHLRHAAELQRRDDEVARDLALIGELADRAGAVRARAAEVDQALARLPEERDALASRRVIVAAVAASARSELEAAEARLADLEAARRAKPDELERVRSEAATARQEVADAESQLERLDVEDGRLRAREAELEAEAEVLPREAALVAADLRQAPRVTESARADPGGSLDDVEEWGARVRSALFVARGTLETERERIVVEANALGTAVLGESLGASSVAVIRRRVEERLG